MGDDVLCVVWIIGLLLTIAILRVNCAGDRIDLLTEHLVCNKTQNKEMGHCPNLMITLAIALIIPTQHSYTGGKECGS